MKSFMKKKFLLALLSLIMLIGVVLAGCSTSDSDSTATDDPATNTEEVVKEPPTELTICCFTSTVNFPSGFQDDPVMNFIEEKLNVRLNIITTNSVTDPAAFMAAKMASGDLDDIMIGADIKQIITAKLAINMEDYMSAETTPNLLSDSPSINFRKTFSKNFDSKDIDNNSDGKLYSIRLLDANSMNPLQPVVAPYVRWDLYEKLGYPKVETMDDYIPLLKQMMELEPVNKDGLKNYGISGWFADWGSWVIGTPFQYMSGVSNIAGPLEFSYADQSILPWLTTPTSAKWQAVDWYNKANREGVLDPDSFTLAWGDYLEKSSQGRIMMGWVNWAGPDNAAASFAEAGQPEKGFVTLTPPKITSPGDGNRFVLRPLNPSGAYPVFVSKTSKHPEKALQVIDYLLSVEASTAIHSGLEGLQWDLVDGKPVLKPEVLQALKDDPEYAAKSGAFDKYTNIAGLGNGTQHPEYKMDIDFRTAPALQPERLTVAMKKMTEHYGITLPMDLWYDRALKCNASDPVKCTETDNGFPGAFDVMPEDIAAIDKEISAILDTSLIKLISIKDEAKYKAEKQKLIDQMLKMGYQKHYDWFAGQTTKYWATFK